MTFTTTCTFPFTTRNRPTEAARQGSAGAGRLAALSAKSGLRDERAAAHVMRTIHAARP